MSYHDRIMLRRPGDEYGIYLAPDFVERHTGWHEWTSDDPRWGGDALDHYSLSLPHSCDEWVIGEGDRASVLTDAMALREQLDRLISVLSAEDGAKDGATG